MITRLAREHWPTLAEETLVLWLIAGPPALSYGTIHSALANHIALAMALGALIAIASTLPAANITVALLGAWLSASPWLTGYASTTTRGTINDLGEGVSSALRRSDGDRWHGRQRRPGPAATGRRKALSFDRRSTARFEAEISTLVAGSLGTGVFIPHTSRTARIMCTAHTANWARA